MKVSARGGVEFSRAHKHIMLQTCKLYWAGRNLVQLASWTQEKRARKGAPATRAERFVHVDRANCKGSEAQKR